MKDFGDPLLSFRVTLSAVVPTTRENLSFENVPGPPPPPLPPTQPCARAGVCGPYLLLNVLERIRGIDGEADQNDVRVGVGERAKTIVVLLARGIPKGEFDMLAVDLNIGNVVFKNGRNVNLDCSESNTSVFFFFTSSFPVSCFFSSFFSVLFCLSRFGEEAGGCWVAEQKDRHTYLGEGSFRKHAIDDKQESVNGLSAAQQQQQQQQQIEGRGR